MMRDAAMQAASAVNTSQAGRSAADLRCVVPPAPRSRTVYDLRIDPKREAARERLIREQRPDPGLGQRYTGAPWFGADAWWVPGQQWAWQKSRPVAYRAGPVWVSMSCGGHFGCEEDALEHAIMCLRLGRNVRRDRERDGDVIQQYAREIRSRQK